MTTIRVLQRVRVDRLLSSQGLCSRSEAKEIINQGRVRVEGVRVRGPAQTIEAVPGTHFRIDTTDYQYMPRLYVMCYKPKGYDCTHKSKYYNTIYELFPSYWLRRSFSQINTCGRLKVNHTGLIFASDDGRFSHYLCSPKNKLTRRYQITFTEPLTDVQIRKFKEGVRIEKRPHVVTKFEKMEQLSDLTWEIGILEDELLSIMLVAVDVYINECHRVQIGNIRLPDHIHENEWTYLDNQDLKDLGYHYKDLMPKKEPFKAAEVLNKGRKDKPEYIYNKYWAAHSQKGEELLDINDRWDY